MAKFLKENFMIQKIKNRINALFESKFNNKIIPQLILSKKKVKQYSLPFQGYWNEVATEIYQASEDDDGRLFFKNPIVINHLASEDYLLGYKLVNKIMAHRLGPDILNKCSTPPWGRPFLLKNFPFLSPTTASHLSNILAIQDVFKLDIAECKTFIDFGGGYGGLARCLVQISNLIQVSIIDLPKMHHVQKKYLAATTSFATNVQFFSEANDLHGFNYEIFNASFSMSEVPIANRQGIENLIFNKCRRCFIIFQDSFNEINNNSYMHELAEKLKTRGWDVAIKKYSWYETGCNTLVAKKY